MHLLEAFEVFAEDYGLVEVGPLVLNTRIPLLGVETLEIRLLGRYAVDTVSHSLEDHAFLHLLHSRFGSSLATLGVGLGAKELLVVL